MKPFLMAAVMLLPPVMAHATTAEDAVIYMLNRTEATGEASGENTWKKEDNSYTRKNTAIKDGKSVDYELKYTVKKIDNCNYGIEIYNKNSNGVVVKNIFLDFSNVRGVNLIKNGLLYRVEFDNLKICYDKQGNACRDFPADSDSEYRAERVKKAYQFLKENYCRGAAF